LILGNIIARIANLGSKKAGLRSVLGKVHDFKELSIGKRAFIGVCYYI
jgi:hypothetical protein